MDDAEDRLTAFEELLRDAAIPFGLVARSDSERLRERHIDDSLRAVEAFSPADRLAYDLGSGAGLPGIPLAIALPQCRFVLSEPRQRRAAFLEVAIEELGLENAEVFSGRAEEMRAGADVCTARAFAPLERAWPIAAKLLRPGGRLIYFAGASLEEPAAVAGALPGPPRDVDVLLASGTPLVIMVRK